MQKLTQDIIDRLDTLFSSDWEDLSCDYELTEDFMRTYQSKLDWELISQFQNLTEQFIIELQDKISFQHLVWFQSKKLKTYSKETQMLIVKNILYDIPNAEFYYFRYMTDYMKKHYEKLSIFL